MVELFCNLTTVSIFGMHKMSPHQETKYAVVDALRRFSEIAEQAIDMGAAGKHMHRTDMRTLSILQRNFTNGTEVTTSSIARALGISAASATSLVDRLESRGHAQRKRSTIDRRIVNVLPTATALQEARNIFLPISQAILESLDGFSKQELTIACEVLSSAAKALEKHIDG